MHDHKQVAKLSLFFFFLLFLAGRIGLFLHEFAGHALAWRLMGGRLTGFSLFIFGGGRVQFGQMPGLPDISVTQQLAVQLSGIAVELAVGIILTILAIILSLSRAVRALFVSVAGVLSVHALFYLTVGAYYGSGDGHLLFTLLQGGSRQFFLLLTFGMTIIAAYVISYQFSPMVKSWIKEGVSEKKTSTIILCGCMAVLLHAMLTFGERIVVNDTVYAGIKMSENDRLKEAELSKFIADYVEKNGTRPDREQLRDLEKALKKKYWQFPLDIFLGMGIMAASLFGYLNSKRNEYQESNPISWKDIYYLGSISMLVAGLILVLNQI